jgi:hypothetical protein
MRRDLDFDDDGDGMPCGGRRMDRSAERMLRELQLGGGQGAELALVSRTAEQQAQLVAASERIDALESQRRWLWAGVGVSALVFGIMLFRSQRPAPQDQRGTKPDKQAAA